MEEIEIDNIIKKTSDDAKNPVLEEVKRIHIISIHSILETHTG